jgi:hypothetical protein
MRYILGSDTSKSYLIGFGTNQPQRPHHRQSACSARYNEPCSASDSGTCCAGESGECKKGAGSGLSGLRSGGSFAWRPAACRAWGVC